MAGAAIAALGLSLLQLRPSRTPSRRLVAGPAEQRPASPRHQACRRRSRGVRRAPGPRPPRAGHLPPPSLVPSALLCGGRRAAGAREPGAVESSGAHLSAGAGSGAGLQGAEFFYLFFVVLMLFHCFIFEAYACFLVSLCLLFASVGQASARPIASLPSTLFTSLLTPRLVLLCASTQRLFHLLGSVRGCPGST